MLPTPSWLRFKKSQAQETAASSKQTVKQSDSIANRAAPSASLTGEQDTLAGQPDGSQDQPGQSANWRAPLEMRGVAEERAGGRDRAAQLPRVRRALARLLQRTLSPIGGQRAASLGRGSVPPTPTPTPRPPAANEARREKLHNPPPISARPPRPSIKRLVEETPTDEGPRPACRLTARTSDNQCAIHGTDERRHQGGSQTKRRGRRRTVPVAIWPLGRRPLRSHSSFGDTEDIGNSHIGGRIAPEPVAPVQDGRRSNGPGRRRNRRASNQESGGVVFEASGYDHRRPFGHWFERPPTSWIVRANGPDRIRANDLEWVQEGGLRAKVLAARGFRRWSYDDQEGDNDITIILQPGDLHDIEKRAEFNRAYFNRCRRKRQQQQQQQQRQKQKQQLINDPLKTSSNQNLHQNIDQELLSNAGAKLTDQPDETSKSTNPIEQHQSSLAHKPLAKRPSLIKDAPPRLTAPLNRIDITTNYNKYYRDNASSKSGPIIDMADARIDTSDSAIGGASVSMSQPSGDTSAGRGVFCQDQGDDHYDEDDDLKWAKCLLDQDYSLSVRLFIRESALNWNFNSFTFDAMCCGRSLTELLLHLFDYYNLYRIFNLDIVNVLKCFRLLEFNYHSTNPYHNSIHAADVTQAMHCFIQENKIRRHMTHLEILSSILAAVCHDLDHPGVNQSFLVATKNPLASLYNNDSVLENHHWRFALCIFKESQLFDHFEEPIFEEMKLQLKNLILATDIARQNEYLRRFRDLTSSHEFSMRNTEDRALVLQMALKCADLGNPCRPWVISRVWSNLICDEFYRMGKVERQLGIPLTPICQRDKTSIAGIQTDFFHFIVLPLLELWHKFLESPLSNLLMSNFDHNYKRWQRANRIVQQLRRRKSIACIEPIERSDDDQHHHHRQSLVQDGSTTFPVGLAKQNDLEPNNQRGRMIKVGDCDLGTNHPLRYSPKLDDLMCIKKASSDYVKSGNLKLEALRNLQLDRKIEKSSHLYIYITRIQVESFLSS